MAPDNTPLRKTPVQRELRKAAEVYTTGHYVFHAKEQEAETDGRKAAARRWCVGGLDLVSSGLSRHEVLPTWHAKKGIFYT